MNILTFDIEEWFHLLDNDSTKSVNQWNSFESRIHYGMNLIYDILDKYQVKATFFVVGWIAEKYPEIIREISCRGFEIGSHTHFHQLVYEQDRQKFYNDVEKSIKILEDCTGNTIRSFRAPGFSITKNNLWAFEVLHELGITKDSSVFPAGRAHGGLKSFGSAIPSVIEYNGLKLKEFPINTHTILGKPFIFSGGGYFRLLPYKIIKKFTLQSNYVMTYFHPRDFDIEQPMVPGLTYSRRFKSYVGIKNCKPKLERWLNDFNFIDLNQADQLINWNQVPVIKL
ncbi:polysaccharide deacetylase family protein [Flavobacteriaceae bacterium]|jgi:peptidoglycan-N-acetylglucosamine deacetylase|nr:polysaccharide deacetylase family protein [Flavobacteriaceae bacterium]